MAEARTPEWLERANRFALTSMLLAATVHEVNNALQVISGSAEMLAPASPPDIIVRRTDAISAHARRASALLAELSAFAKDDTTNTMRLDLGHVAQRALAMRQYTMAKLKLQTSFEARGESRTVVANARLLLQLVLNLVVNAERALADHVGGRILLVLEGNPERVTLSVEDNGAGIAPEALPKLFDPSAPLASPGHLGIGLAVSRHLAGQFAGTLSHDPRPDGGARFMLSLPAAPAA